MSRALQAFGDLLREQPDDVAVIRQVATAEAKGGDLESAERWLLHALQLKPDDHALLFQRGEVAYHRGLNEAARSALERAVALAPEDADAWYLLGFVRGDIGDHEAAMAARRQAQRLNASLGTARANLSLERFDARSWHVAREEKASRGLVPPPAADANLARYHLGLAFRQKGYLAEALATYRQALERGEDHQLVTHGMAIAHLLKGEMAEACGCYDELLARYPALPSWWNERGVALHSLGRHADALESYRHGAEFQTPDIAALNNLGVASYHRGDVERAEAALRQALELDPARSAVRLNLALLLARTDQPARALEAYRLVLARSPGHPVAWNGAGLVLLGLRRLDAARNAFSRAIDAKPAFAAAHYNLGSVLSQLGEHDDALRETTRALELESLHAPPAFELIVELEGEVKGFAIAPGVAADTTVAEFSFEPAALEELFDDMLAAPATDVTPTDPWAAVRACVAAAEWDAAHALVRRRLADGLPRADASLVQGEVFLAQGMHGEALERFREARDAGAWPVAAVTGEVRALAGIHRHEDALPLTEWLDRETSPSVDTLLLIAEVYREVGKSAEARDALDRAVQQAPRRADVHAASGALARQLGDLEAAIASLQAAVSLDAAMVDAHVELSELLEAADDRVTAERQLIRATGIDPLHAGAALALGRLRREDGRAAASIADLASFLIAQPWQLDVLASLGESLALAGRARDARVAVARVLRFDADHGGALYVEGMLRRAAHDFAGAIRFWQRVVDVEPASHHARRAHRALAEATERRRLLLGAAVAEVG